MPTLIRLFIVLLVLVALAIAGMLALSIFVQPGQKEIRVPIPPEQLGITSNANPDDPLGILATPAPPAPVAPPVTTTTREEEPLPPGTREVDIPE
jgi:hypothetical protein